MNGDGGRGGGVISEVQETRVVLCAVWRGAEVDAGGGIGRSAGTLGVVGVGVMVGSRGIEEFDSNGARLRILGQPLKCYHAGWYW